MRVISLVCLAVTNICSLLLIQSIFISVTDDGWVGDGDGFRPSPGSRYTKATVHHLSEVEDYDI